jgi:transcriptional regulator with XRE-family HTH domain
MNPRHPCIGQFVAAVIEEKGMSKAEFARRIGTSRQNVSLILRKDSLDTWMLWRICEVLETDFFQMMSVALNGGLVVHSPASRAGKMEIKLELSDAEMVRVTADLVRGGQ